ncbi:MAG TPA: cytochrome c biogenesis protein CcsA [Calditrichia bacterium]|nr:cytochrome c biogenesis protein CcsA [Calditrichia bacterium]
MRNGMWWKSFLAVWMSVVIWAAFYYAPRAKALGETTRVLFFHVPCAWVATLSFIVAAIASILYLRNARPQYDWVAYASSHLGLLFTVLASVTGAVWANEIWGDPWNWDPRQTSIFFLMLIYAAYFALRSGIEDPAKQARLAAVYAIIAGVAMPFFMFIVPRIYESLHPDPLINESGKVKMNGKMLQVFLSSMFGFTVLYFWMLRQKIALLRGEFMLMKKLIQEGEAR